MWPVLLTLVPTGLVLGLVAFGRYGGRRVRPNARSTALVAVTSVLSGPVAVAALGFWLWLLLVAVAISALTMAAMLRPPRRPLSG